MKIKEIEFKNFTSYGNKMQKIEFEKDSNDLYLVLGKTGAGKSSLSKVITYLCYGKVSNSNLKDLPNRVNKELWGKIKLESKNNQIEIERGMNPSVFNVKINNTEYDVAGKSNLQDFLENEMFEIPYHVFKNVIILSVNDFKSFITMSPRDKKMIIDKIFGFSIINDMRELIKNNHKTVLEEISSYENEINSINESIESIKNKIKQIEKINEEKDNKKLIQLKERLVKLNENKKKIIAVNLKIKDKISKFNQEFKKYSQEESQLKNDIRNTKNWIKLYQNKKCPTCHSSLTTGSHKKIKEEKEERLKELLDKVDNVNKEVKNTESKIVDIRNKGKELSVKIGQLDIQMKNLKDELILLSKRESQDSDYFKQLIQEFDKKKESKNSLKFEKESDNYYLDVLERITGDDGIKNLAIKSLIPSFNTHIDVMAKEMGIPFIIKFDEKFNCSIHHIGFEISPKTLSTGERKKVDFVVIIAMIKMIKIRFPSFNILFLDEIFSSVDADGVYHIISILHKTIRDIGLNTFVINHTVLPSEYFDKKIEISKDSGFSEIEIDTIT